MRDSKESVQTEDSLVVVEQQREQTDEAPASGGCEEEGTRDEHRTVRCVRLVCGRGGRGSRRGRGRGVEGDASEQSTAGVATRTDIESGRPGPDADTVGALCVESSGAENASREQTNK